jgi:hypothetical protein
MTSPDAQPLISQVTSNESNEGTQQTEMAYQICVVYDAARLLPNQSVHYWRQKVRVELVVTD